MARRRVSSRHCGGRRHARVDGSAFAYRNSTTQSPACGVASDASRPHQTWALVDTCTMRRYNPAAAIEYSFGPGPVTRAVKIIIITNIVFFVATQTAPTVVQYLGLSPEMVLERGWLWQFVWYMFLHADVLHILFNMLGIWMFGVELERIWGTQFFARFYAVTGIGAGLTVVLASLLPYSFRCARPTTQSRSARQALSTVC